MEYELHFLEADLPLSKEISINRQEKLEKKPYPMVKNFNSHIEVVKDISEFGQVVEFHAAKGHCLLKGHLDRQLFKESRAGHTCSDKPTDFVFLDADGISVPPDELLRILGLEDADPYIQYSSSSGVIREKDHGIIDPPMDRYHIFLLLERPTKPGILKLQLKHWNLNIPILRNQITLNKANTALRYPLDITVCQNDKLIYIARPICHEGVIDTLANS